MVLFDPAFRALPHTDRHGDSTGPGSGELDAFDSCQPSLFRRLRYQQRRANPATRTVSAPSSVIPRLFFFFFFFFPPPPPPPQSLPQCAGTGFPLPA